MSGFRPLEPPKPARHPTQRTPTHPLPGYQPYRHLNPTKPARDRVLQHRPTCWHICMIIAELRGAFKIEFRGRLVRFDRTPSLRELESGPAAESPRLAQADEKFLTFCWRVQTLLQTPFPQLIQTRITSSQRNHSHLLSPATNPSSETAMGNRSQTLLALVLLLATFLSYLTLTPPHTSTSPPPATGDTLRRLGLTLSPNPALPTLLLRVLPFLSAPLAHAYLILAHPRIPFPWGRTNGFPPHLATWSRALCIPLAVLGLVGVPLRLGAFSSLGTNFTFTLDQPDGLKTSGLYALVQHPSYTGLFLISMSLGALFGRVDGVLCCFVPPGWYEVLFRGGRGGLVVPGLWVGVWVAFLALRVVEEESMLRARFGEEWEVWHAATPRFFPWLV